MQQWYVSEFLFILVYYGMNWLHIKLKGNCMIKLGTTFNRVHPKAFTFPVLFGCRPEFHRVETTETLNRGWFRSEVT